MIQNFQNYFIKTFRKNIEANDSFYDYGLPRCMKLASKQAVFEMKFVQHIYGIDSYSLLYSYILLVKYNNKLSKLCINWYLYYFILIYCSITEFNQICIV